MKKIIFITGLLMSIFFYSCKEEDHGILPPIEGGGTVEVKDGRVNQSGRISSCDTKPDERITRILRPGI